MIQERQIFIVRAEVVNSSGGFQPLTLDGATYPVNFDSNLPVYAGDIDKCLNYAKAEWHKVVGYMLKHDDYQLQTAVLMTTGCYCSVGCPGAGRTRNSWGRSVNSLCRLSLSSPI